MQKLTKEQSEYFFNIFTKTSIPYVEQYGKTYLDSKKVCEIVDQCTEKPFPAFDVADVFVTISERWPDEYIDITFTTTPSTDAFWSLRREEFMQFTEGCQKICEWLKEQE